MLESQESHQNNIFRAYISTTLILGLRPANERRRCFATTFHWMRTSLKSALYLWITFSYHPNLPNTDGIVMIRMMLVSNTLPLLLSFLGASPIYYLKPHLLYRHWEHHPLRGVIARGNWHKWFPVPVFKETAGIHYCRRRIFHFYSDELFL